MTSPQSEDPKAFAFPSEYPPGSKAAADLSLGLTKRELFAAMAMQGLCGNSAIGLDLNFAEISVRLADDLLKELAK